MKTRYLVLSLVFALSFAGILTNQSYAKIDPKAIVGLWLFDEGAGDVAKDSSGNEIEGAIMNGPKWVDGKVPPSKGLELDGTDDYILVHIGTALLSLSLEAWIYPTDGGVIFVEEGQAGLDASWYDAQMEILSSGEIKVGFWTGAEQGISLGKYSFGEWYNVVMTYEDGEINGYINGKLVESGKLNKQNPGDLWYAIGARTATNLGDGTHFNGIIDQAAVYNVALTENEVMQNYQEANAVFSADKLSTTWANIRAK